MEKKIIILAAGKGTRMNVDIAKVLVPVKGEPMIERLVKTVSQIGRPVIVVGFQAAAVMRCVGDKADYAFQSDQLGTGHAVNCAKDLLKDFDGAVLVLYGDTPLITLETINKLFTLHEESGVKLSLMTTKVEDFQDWRQGFYSFGRILRDEDGNILGIRELKDCSDEEKLINEVNPGYYCFDSKWLWENIGKIQNKNNQKEYYLTDLIEIAVKEQEKISSLLINPEECLGINTKEQLKFVEEILISKS